MGQIGRNMTGCLGIHKEVTEGANRKELKVNRIEPDGQLCQKSGDSGLHRLSNKSGKPGAGGPWMVKYEQQTRAILIAVEENGESENA